MAEDRMALLETLRKATADGDVDFLREGVRVLAQAGTDRAGAGARCCVERRPAGRGRRAGGVMSPDLVSQRVRP